MNVEQLEAIFDDESINFDWEGDNAMQGLLIITKYLPNRGITGADHDVIYSASVEEIVDAGITEKDVRELRRLNWMVEYGGLACFV